MQLTAHSSVINSILKPWEELETKMIVKINVNTTLQGILIATKVEWENIFQYFIATFQVHEIVVIKEWGANTSHKE